MGRFDLLNHRLLSTLAAVAAQGADEASFLTLTGWDQLDAALALGVAHDLGFIDRATPPGLTEAGCAWASAELAKMSPLAAAVSRPRRAVA